MAEIRRFALERSPFYRRFHAGLEGRALTELPVLTKRILMENFDDLVTDRAVRLRDVEAFLSSHSGTALFRDRYVALSTSGSTGLRGIFLFNDPEWLHAIASISRPMAWAGVKPNPFRPVRTAMVASTVPWHYSSRVGLSVSSRLLPTLRVDAAEALAGKVKRLNDWQPGVLVAYPSALRELAEEQIAGRLRIPLRCVATSAEVLTAETRRRVEQAWQASIYETYGATEYAPIAAECAYGRKHLFEDGAIVEVVDERGQTPRGDAGSRVLLTVFDRRTQPLIRYEISDMVRLNDRSCECGRPFRLIDSIEGRLEDVLYFPSRRTAGDRVAVHPNVFHELLETVPAAGWQVVQTGEGLEIYLLGPTGGEDAAQALERSIRLRMESEGAMVESIRVVPAAQLRRGATGKAPLVFRAP